MKITIKKLKTMNGHEGIAYSCDVYINGKNVGGAIQDGNGGDLLLEFYHEKGSPLRRLCDEAYKWAASLPDGVFTIGGAEHSFPMTLEGYIEDLVENHLKAKEDAKLEIEKRKKLMWGKPNSLQYWVSSWKKKTLAEVPLPVLQSQVDRIKRDMKEGEVFLNAEYLTSLGCKV